MDLVIVGKAAIGAWLEGLRRNYRVVAPVAEGGAPTRYREIRSGAEVALEGPRPLRGPKEHLLPQVEPLLRFRGTGEELLLQPAHPAAPPSVLFGVRPCDGRALRRLDDVFLGRAERDELYGRRREAARLIGLACRVPSWGCFCTSVGGSPAGTEGLDLLLTDLGDRYHARVLTAAGSELAAAVGAVPATMEDDRAAAEQVAVADAALPARFDATALASRIEWASPVWARMARRCLGCGACSFLCPTCHCFDIQDEVTGAGGVRFRCWDTCQQGEFTRMGAGHNPRAGQPERLRQRVSHKFKYLVEEFGRAGCTGCGRCVEACPVNVDIREALVALGGEGR